jgi:hypothetical protein
MAIGISFPGGTHSSSAEGGGVSSFQFSGKSDLGLMGIMGPMKPQLTPALMNPRSELKALKDWKDLELNSLTLTG